jgi:hypothetical protein
MFSGTVITEFNSLKSKQRAAQELQGQMAPLLILVLASHKREYACTLGVVQGEMV